MRALTLSLAIALLPGCLIGPGKPVMAKLVVPTLRVNGDAEVTSEGLSVTITPITEDNVRTFPQIWKSFSYEQAVRDAMGKVVVRPAMLSLGIAPLPAFEVRIANNTGHVIRLTTAVFRLESNTGKKWNTFASTKELGDWTGMALSAKGIDPALQMSIPAQVSKAVDGVQFLTRSAELLKGDEWSGYLVFNLGAAAQGEYDALMHSTERFTLRMAEVPVETGDAGQITKTTEFNFALDKSTAEVAVVCPARTTTPSWDAGCVLEQ